MSRRKAAPQRRPCQTAPAARRRHERPLSCRGGTLRADPRPDFRRCCHHRNQFPRNPTRARGIGSRRWQLPTAGTPESELGLPVLSSPCFHQDPSHRLFARPTSGCTSFARWLRSASVRPAVHTTGTAHQTKTRSPARTDFPMNQRVLRSCRRYRTIRNFAYPAQPAHSARLAAWSIGMQRRRASWKPFRIEPYLPWSSVELLFYAEKYSIFWRCSHALLARIKRWDPVIPGC